MTSNATQTITSEMLEYVTELATRYEENFGNWGRTPAHVIALHRDAWNARNMYLSLLSTGRAELI